MTTVSRSATVVNMKAKQAVSIRLPVATDQRLKVVQAAMIRATGLDVDRSQVLRLLLARSLPTLEKEYGIEPVDAE